MAKKSLIVKKGKLQNILLKSKMRGEKMPLQTRVYNRCRLCGRPRGYMRKFDMCRICFKELARKGLIIGIKKSSW